MFVPFPNRLPFQAAAIASEDLGEGGTGRRTDGVDPPVSRLGRNKRSQRVQQIGSFTVFFG